MAYSAPAGNITSTADIFYWVNSVTDNWFFPGAIIAVFIIILARLMYRTDNLGQAFAGASFVCMILTVLLRVANLVKTEFMVIFIILTSISALWMHLENARNQ